MVENRVYISNVLQITKNDRNDLKWTKMSSSNLKKMFLKKTCEKKEKKNFTLARQGIELQSPGRKACVPRSKPSPLRC